MAGESAHPIRVTVWDERQPQQKSVYTNFLGNEIAGYLKTIPGLNVRSVALDDPGQGLGQLEDCDVLVWWGHIRNKDLRPEAAKEVVRRIESGRLSLITLHSAHWSRPFVEAMNLRARQDALRVLSVEEQRGAMVVETNLFARPYTAPKYFDLRTPSALYRKPIEGPVRVELTLPNCCFPAYRGDGKPSQIRILRPDHPIARGVPAQFAISQTEMYDEPFHVPPPDEVILEERWTSGEWFRSGCVWQIGRGRVFYFRPGHETFPVYKNQNVLKIIGNAVQWLGGEGQGIK